jgi:hypothetical protein
MRKVLHDADSVGSRQDLNGFCHLLLPLSWLPWSSDWLGAHEIHHLSRTPAGDNLSSWWNRPLHLGDMMRPQQGSPTSLSDMDFGVAGHVAVISYIPVAANSVT